MWVVHVIYYAVEDVGRKQEKEKQEFEVKTNENNLHEFRRGPWKQFVQLSSVNQKIKNEKKKSIAAAIEWAVKALVKQFICQTPEKQ